MDYFGDPPKRHIDIIEQGLELFPSRASSRLVSCPGLVGGLKKAFLSESQPVPRHRCRLPRSLPKKAYSYDGEDNRLEPARLVPRPSWWAQESHFAQNPNRCQGIDAFSGTKKSFGMSS